MYPEELIKPMKAELENAGFNSLTTTQEVENATIVAIICDRGDRYLSTGVYSD